MTFRVAVLGGGLQGACVALEFAAAGATVDLYDRENELLNRSSSNNEGKIHLGYVYANDTTLRTASLMLRGALTFFPFLRRLVGPGLDALPISTPFYYLVHRNSLKHADEIEAHLRAVADLARHFPSKPQDYFGRDHSVQPTRLSLHDSCFAPETVVAAFRTPEIAVDPESLAQTVRDAVKSCSDIRCILGTTIETVSRLGSSLVVRFTRGGVGDTEGYDHVVNTLWEGRLALDLSFGIRAARPWLHRMKYFAVGPSNGIDLPSCTVVLGPFGDVVSYGSARRYLSWYPAGMTAKTSDLCPPYWPSALLGREADGVRRRIVAGLSTVLPGVGRLGDADLGSLAINGGPIVAWGESDIDDAASGLHDRFDVGPRSYGNYHSVDTGKLTTAPLFARELVEAVTGRRR